MRLSSLKDLSLPQNGGPPTGRSGKRGGFFAGLAIGVLLFILFQTATDSLFFRQKQTPPDETSTEQTTGPRKKGEFPAVEVCHVSRCVDGDTIIILSGNESQRVRLIGVDTPETVKPNTPVQPFGLEASDHLKKRIEEYGGFVTLKTDGDRTDRFGRRLAMVYLGKEGKILLNEELIQAGLGRAELEYRYSDAMKKRFRQAENEAKKGNRGIWSLNSSSDR